LRRRRKMAQRRKPERKTASEVNAAAQSAASASAEVPPALLAQLESAAIEVGIIKQAREVMRMVEGTTFHRKRKNALTAAVLEALLEELP
jgi:hypothetical protein